MEKEGAAAAAKPLSKLAKKTSSSTSFRLHSPSLNSVRLRRIFDLFDKNTDGMITVPELTQCLNVLGLEADPSEMEFMVISYIKPGNVGLQFDDFESLHRSLNDALFGLPDEEDDEFIDSGENDAAEDGDEKSQEESDLREAFKVFDEDGDGYISARELQTVLSKLGLAEGKEMDRVEKMILSVDTNHDGRVDFSEFKNMMRSVIVRSA